MSDDKRKLTLGSLFDGSGGFPLGGILAGVTPVWASEVEPFAIRVTTKRLPFMKHYGDVSKLNGAEVPPVDIITFGSPCQDMSVAGKRAGLDGSRSGLFHEAIRIIKEMRCRTNGQYPRYIVWENVPGAFSSNGGADFRSVLEEICKVKSGEADVPQPDKWETAGQILGEDFSVAWRVFDAQYWGVPQRRKRIYLVADFAGMRAPDILFKSDGLSGYSAEGIGAWQRTACRLKEGAGEAGGCLNLCINPQGNSGVGITDGQTLALVAQDHGNHPAVLQAAGFCTEHSAQSRSVGYEEEVAPTLRAGTTPATVYENHAQDTRFKEMGEVCQTLTSSLGTGGNNQPLVVSEEPEPVTMKIRCGKEGGGKGILCQRDKSATLSCNNDQTLFQPVESQGFDRYNGRVTGDVAHTLNTGVGDNMPMVFQKEQAAYGISRVAFNGGMKAAFNFSVNEEVVPTLETGGPHAVAEPEIKAFGVCSKSSHSMLSDNPNSGFYEAETSRTLDQSGGNPTCNQGGICIVEKDPAYALQGSMIGREEKNGPQGGGINEDVSFTLNTCDKHAVAQPTYAATVGSFMSVSEETAQTLMARDYKDPQIVNDPQEEPMYIVRRLTPVECARLQGFPDWWCMGLGTEEPSEDEITFWADVFETHRMINNPKGKPKTRNQILKWLKNPHTDGAEYKLWGNGVCLNNVYFVLAGIVWADGSG